MWNEVKMSKIKSLLIIIVTLAWLCAQINCGSLPSAIAPVKENINLAKEHCIKGQRLLLQDKSEEALQEFKAATSAAPVYYDGHRKYIDLMEQLGRKDRLPDEYKSFLNTYKGNAITHCLKAKLTDDLEITRQETEKAIEIDPLCYAAYASLAYYYEEKKDYDKSISLIKKTIEINAEYSHGYFRLAQVYGRKGDINKAIEFYEQGIKLDSIETGVYVNLSKLYGDVHENDKAIINANKAIEIDKRPLYLMMAYMNRGMAFKHKNEVDQSLKDWAVVAEIARQEKSAEILFGVAGALDASGEPDQAGELLAEALKYNPSPQLAGQIRAALNKIKRTKESASQETIPPEVYQSIEKAENKMMAQIMSQPDNRVNLAETVLSFTKKVNPKIDINKYLKKLDEMTEELRVKIGSQTDPEKVVDLINEYLYKDNAMRVGRMDFSLKGVDLFVDISTPVSEDDFWLDGVLDANQGSCLGFTILYLALAERLNLPFYGVLLPGHIFVRYDNGKYQHNIEPTNQGEKYTDEDYYTGKFSPLSKFTPQPDYFYLKNMSRKQVIQCFLMMRGRYFKGKKMYDQALADFNRAFEIGPGIDEIYINRGSGYYAKQNYVQALSCFKQYLESRPDGVWRPSVMYAIGATYAADNWVGHNTAEAVKWYRQAAEKGDPDAQNSLGAAYFHGTGVEKNEAEAVKWFRQAAEQGYAEAQKNMGAIYYNGTGVEKDEAEAVKWFLKAAEQGYAEAQNKLGEAYFNGTGIAKNEAEAVKWFRQAAEQGHALAQSILGNCYVNGLGVDKDITEAIKWYRKSAEQGCADGQINLGACYFSGIGVDKDADEAMKWYRRAAEQGNPDAQNTVGAIYYNGTGVEKNDAEARKWFRKAAEQGHTQAQSILGFIYIKGYGVDKDEVDGLKWILKSAEQGYAEAQKNMGFIYYDGIAGVIKDNKEALKWFSKAAAQGNQESINMLKKLNYLNDVEGTVNKYRQAAEQGDADAQYNLGRAYEKGLGVDSDVKEAVKWYLKAAEQGHAQAQFEIGLSYYIGLGVEENKDEAMKWFNKSAQQGCSDAISKLQLIKEKEGKPK